MSSREEVSYPILLKHDVDYVLVIFGGLLGYSGDDINKVFPHPPPSAPANPSFSGWFVSPRVSGPTKSKKKTSSQPKANTASTTKQPPQCATPSCTKCPTTGNSPPPPATPTNMCSDTINYSLRDRRSIVSGERRYLLRVLNWIRWKKRLRRRVGL